MGIKVGKSLGAGFDGFFLLKLIRKMRRDERKSMKIPAGAFK